MDDLAWGYNYFKKPPYYHSSFSRVIPIVIQNCSLFPAAAWDGTAKCPWTLLDWSGPRIFRIYSKMVVCLMVIVSSASFGTTRFIGIYEHEWQTGRVLHPDTFRVIAAGVFETSSCLKRSDVRCTGHLQDKGRCEQSRRWYHSWVIRFFEETPLSHAFV